MTKDQLLEKIEDLFSLYNSGESQDQPETGKSHEDRLRFHREILGLRNAIAGLNRTTEVLDSRQEALDKRLVVIEKISTPVFVPIGGGENITLCRGINLRIYVDGFWVEGKLQF